MTMAVVGATTREARFMMTDLAQNNDNFWNIQLMADGSCETHWLRFSEDRRRKIFPNYFEVFFDAKCCERTSKGYQPAKTLANMAPDVAKSGAARLARTVAEQIAASSPDFTKC